MKELFIEELKDIEGGIAESAYEHANGNAPFVENITTMAIGEEDRGQM